MSNNHSQKILLGKIVSAKTDKTVIVEIDHLVSHPVYQKFRTRTIRLHAHDEENRCQIGDIVKIVESRPISKTKTFRVLEVVKRTEIEIKDE